jgi:hypothetical protein
LARGLAGIEQTYRPSGRREAEELPMTTATWITMIVVMTFGWGGISLVLFTAIRNESGKSGGA